MGCHTWCAIKVERSIEEARAIWIEKRRAWIEDWEEYLLKKSNGEKLEIFDEYSIETFVHLLEVFQRQLRMVEKGLCNVAVMNDQPEHSYYKEGHGFFVNSDFHDVFRVYGYPNDWLYSKEETLAYIEKWEKDHPEDEPLKFWKFTEGPYKGRTGLDVFWELHPNGSIHFG
jgi:hypothetical protein